MLEITITIKEVSENKETSKDSIKGKYIISNSNYNNAYIYGVPCKVMSEPFMGIINHYAKERPCIKVISCITGIEYVIPYNNYFKIYDSFSSVLIASERFLHHKYSVYSLPEMQDDLKSKLVGKKYYPNDNSYSKLLSDYGNRFVAGEEVEIIEEPYIDKTPYGELILFVNVQKNDGTIVKCMFAEWKLLP